MSEQEDGAQPTETVEVDEDVKAEESSAPESVEVSTEDAETDEGSGEDGKPKKSKGGFQKRIERLSRRLEAAERLAAHERSERERIESESAKGREVASEAEDQAPARDQFDDYEAFLEARARWVARQEWREQEQQRETRERDSRSQRERVQLESAWQDQVEDATDKYSDFNEVALSPTLPVTTEMARVLMEAEDGADVLYWLGKNPEDASRLSRQSGQKLAISIGRIGERLARERERERSKAPKPPPTAKGSAGAQPNALSDKADIKAWMDARNKQLQERRRA